MFVFIKILNYETTRRDSRGSGASPKNTLGTEGVAGMTNYFGNQMNEMIKNEK